VIRESQELQEIEAALGRIGDGSYGSCSDCGDDIARRAEGQSVSQALPALPGKYERAQARYTGRTIGDNPG